MLTQVALEFGVTPAEAVVLMTVGYEIPLPPQEFIEHAVWESVGTVDERQVSEGFDNCLLKRWICLTQSGLPEFTDEGEKLWSDIRQMLQKRREEQITSQAERTEERRRQELCDWCDWTEVWKTDPTNRFSEGSN